VQDDHTVFVRVLIINGVLTDGNMEVAYDEVGSVVIRADKDVLEDTLDVIIVIDFGLDALPGIVPLVWITCKAVNSGHKILLVM
jgi:hypothetical protein